MRIEPALPTWCAMPSPSRSPISQTRVVTPPATAPLVVGPCHRHPSHDERCAGGLPTLPIRRPTSLGLVSS